MKEVVYAQQILNQASAKMNMVWLKEQKMTLDVKLLANQSTVDLLLL